MNLKITSQALDFIERLEKKQKQQVAAKIIDLMSDPFPPDNKKLIGAKGGERRITSGDLRIVYAVEGDTVEVLIVGNRNKVYEVLRRQ